MVSSAAKFLKLAEKGAALVEKVNFEAAIKSAAGAASPTAWELHGSAPKPSLASRSRRPGAPMQLPSRQGGCASSRLDHGLKVELFPQERLPFVQYLAPLGAKHFKKSVKNI